MTREQRPAARTSSEGTPGAVSVRVAGLLRRAAAALIDLLLLAPVLLGCGALIRLVHDEVPTRLADAVELLLARHPLALAAAAVAATLWLLYQFFFCALSGGTPGMRALRMAFVDEAGDPPGLGTAAVRAVTTALAVAPLGLGLLWAAFDREKRGLHDHLAGTYVVVAPARGRS